jgi:6-methylsalicylate decarboxylase
LTVRIDTHQHLLGERLIGELESRRSPPRVIRSGSSWWLVLAGEAPSVVDGAVTDIELRTRLTRADGSDRALISLSSALGIEGLAPDAAGRLLAAYHADAAELPAPFAAWGAVALDDPDPSRVDELLDAGFVGIALPATAFATPAVLHRVGPLLERLERRDAPLFVHPGPAAAGQSPPWWPAMTDYLAQMNAAWHAFVAAGRGAHPTLRVVFAALAGGAPLHLERLAQRGGPARDALAPELFYDCSSYATRALDALVRVVGADQVVFGSDRPFATPASHALGDALDSALRVSNPARLLGPAEIVS